MTKVVHCKRDKFDVYIGRTSKWGNPFILTKNTTRAIVLEQYKRWIMSQDSLRAQIKTELKDKVLGCWCAPKQCHGDVLAEIADEEMESN